MPATTCTACGADLDAVPGRAPCPSCGGLARTFNVGITEVAHAADQAQVEVIVRAALDELAAMPADVAQALLEEARRRLAPTGAPQQVRHEVSLSAEVYATATADAHLVIGVEQDSVFIPANARTWRDLLIPRADEVRVAVLNAVVTAGVAYLVASHASPAATADVSRAAGPHRAVPAVVIHEPTPPPPLPPLLGPEDSTRDDDKGEHGEDDGDP